MEEHLNSYNSPYKFNAKELDEETGNYYYWARYYNPKWSIWLSVDPLAEKYPGWSPYNYTLQNPVKFVDPTGMVVEYHKDNSLWFNLGAKLRIFAQSIFGTKETRSTIKQLKETDNVITIKQDSEGSFLGSNAQPKKLYDYEETALEDPSLQVPGVDATKEQWQEYEKKFQEYQNNKPTEHKDGTGDGSYVTLDYTKISKKDGYKRNKTTELFHELFHAKRIDDGAAQDRKTEEIKASQFINRNFRNEKNRRRKYGDWKVPAKN
ncbi:RHS repeat-associated core domain-containing protein [Mesonia aestuariivivens]|uniref:RHS repeat-associated core domain-containing protein n=1 Tax=Mesonia aestuariivivens TaxID=2796128 RepID=UPI0034E1B797